MVYVVAVFRNGNEQAIDMTTFNHRCRETWPPEDSILRVAMITLVSLIPSVLLSFEFWT